MCNHREFQIPTPLAIDKKTRKITRKYLADVNARLDADADRRREFWRSTLRDIAWYLAALIASVAFSWWLVTR